MKFKDNNEVHFGGKIINHAFDQNGTEREYS